MLAAGNTNTRRKITALLMIYWRIRDRIYWLLENLGDRVELWKTWQRRVTAKVSSATPQVLSDLNCSCTGRQQKAPKIPMELNKNFCSPIQREIRICNSRPQISRSLIHSLAIWNIRARFLEQKSYLLKTKVFVVSKTKDKGSRLKPITKSICEPSRTKVFWRETKVTISRV